MKKIFAILFLAVFTFAAAFTQVQSFKYQAVIRDKSGVILSDNHAGIKVSILQGQNLVYSEEFKKTTDMYGMINIEVGRGTVLKGNYLNIDWSKEDYMLQIDIDINGGKNYELLGTSPILSVPIANFAQNANHADSASQAKKADYAMKSFFPAGMIQAFAGDTTQIPEGWILCDGRELSRTEYMNLFNTIGINWGYGDKISTFNIPDLRGQFLRGVLGTADTINDPDVNSRIPNSAGTTNAPGSKQIDAFQSHMHIFSYRSRSKFSSLGGGSYEEKWSGERIIDGTTGSPNGNTSTETRPRNVYVNYIIKY